MSMTLPPRVELALAACVTVLGIAVTSWAVLVHAATLVAPGALFVTIGGAWLGNAMARHGVRLIPVPPADATEGTG